MDQLRDFRFSDTRVSHQPVLFFVFQRSVMQSAKVIVREASVLTSQR